MIAEAAPLGQAVLVGDVVRHQDLLAVAVLDEAEDLHHAPAVIGHVEVGIVGVVGRLEPEQVVLEIAAGLGEIHQMLAVRDGAVDVAHDGPLEIPTLLRHHVEDLRGGAGVFYDRTGSGPIRDRLRFDGQRLREVNITDPGYPDPFSSGETLATEPSNIVRFAPNLRSPYTFQYSIGVERQLTKSLAATATYFNIRGIKLFRSRDINAPALPELERPNPGIGVLRQIESAARSQAHTLELTLRGSLSRFFDGTIQYNLGRAYNDTGGINSRPADSYDLSGEWARASFDERHRFNLLGTIRAGEWLNLGMTLALISGRPYSLTTGRDDNRNGVASDRPSGVARNSLQGPGSAVLDVRWSKEFRLKKEANKKEEEGPVFTFAVAAFNVLNRTSYSGFVGNLSSPFFGLPVASRPARRLQLTLGFEF